MGNSPIYERGQILLIVVLVMVVALTVGLGVASRSITNLHVATEEAFSQKAFYAAESGIEEALKLSQTGNSVIANQFLDTQKSTSITEVDVQPIQGTSVLFNNGDYINQDDGVDLWLSTFSTDPTKIFTNQWPNSGTATFTVYWGTSTDNCGVNPPQAAALEVILMTGSKNAPIFTRYPLDPCPTRASSNNFNKNTADSQTFTIGGAGLVNGVNFPHSFSISISSTSPGLIARIIPLYANTPIGVNANVNLPSQGKIITSLGSAGSTQRKIYYFQGYEVLPSEFFYAAFSPK